MRRVHAIELSDEPWFPDGIRLVNTFHHLRPDAARAVLQDAVDAGQPIVVAELLRRHPLIVAMNLAAGLPLFAIVPFLRPFRFSWLLFTYLIPLIPLGFTVDALVSTLRIYSEEELREMIASLDGPDRFDWSFEYVSMPPSPIPSLILVGAPRAGGGH